MGGSRTGQGTLPAHSMEARGHLGTLSGRASLEIASEGLFPFCCPHIGPGSQDLEGAGAGV
jgi:hypothetical protein